MKHLGYVQARSKHCDTKRHVDIFTQVSVFDAFIQITAFASVNN